MQKTLRWREGGLSLIAFVVLLLPLVCSENTADAADWFVTPQLTVVEEYNSNVLYSQTVKLSDFITYVRPRVTGAYETERFSVSGNAGIGIEKFIDNTDLDTINQNYNLGASYAVLETLRFDASGYFRRDTTLETELVEEGFLATRQDRRSYGGNFGFQYTYSERLSFAGGYTRSYVEFPGSQDNLVDYKGNYFYLSPQYVLSPKITLLMDLSYSMTKYDPETGQTFDIIDRQISNYRFIPQVRYNYSETLYLTAGVGFRYTESEFQGSANWNPQRK